MSTPLAAPFPYPGGKRRIAAEVWARFGDPARYVEPFAGGLAVLLARPGGSPLGHEVVGDAFAMVSNFWRAVQADPEAVARFMDWPAIQADLTARRQWLQRERPHLAARLANPLAYCPRAAGWWAWVQSVGMGEGREHNGDSSPSTGRRGVVRASIRTAQDPLAELVAIARELQHRLRGVTVLHGDWANCVSPGKLFAHTHAPAPVAVFLDPPYALKATSSGRPSYGVHGGAAIEAREWALANGDNPRLRIALCGYEAEHEDHMPASWERLSWAAAGFNFKGGRAELQRTERVWFSPACLRPAPPKEPDMGPLFQAL